MIPTPLAMQPTEYIRKSWESKPYGQAAKIEVAGVHDGGTWALRASWKGSGPGTRDFPDALALALPVRGKPVLVMMGGKDAPIHYLYWRATQENAQSLLATGVGFALWRGANDERAGIKAFSIDWAALELEA